MTDKAEQPKCGAVGSMYFDQPCDGPMWESPRYFTNGASSYRCEKHAKEGMAINPPMLGGPRYVPVQRRTS